MGLGIIHPISNHAFPSIHILILGQSAKDGFDYLFVSLTVTGLFPYLFVFLLSDFTFYVIDVA